MAGVIARCNGVVLVADDADNVSVMEPGGGWMGTALFVVGLLAVILCGAGIGVGVGARMILVGAVLVGAGGLAMVGAVALYRAWRRSRSVEPTGPVRLVFDCGAGVLRDGAGRALSPLAGVHLARTWQAGSSSKALVVRYEGASIVLCRGTPFGDSVDGVETALAARGVARR